MNTALSLRSLQSLVTGLFITSSHHGRLCETLGLLLNPLELSSVANFKPNDVPLDLLLEGKVAPQTSGQVVRLERPASPNAISESSKIILSGLSGFPLPQWPFFLPDSCKNPFRHFEAYARAYFDQYSVDATQNQIRLALGESSFGFCFESNKLECWSSEGETFLFSTLSLETFTSISFRVSEEFSASMENIVKQPAIPRLSYSGLVDTTEFSINDESRRLLVNIYASKKSNLPAELITEMLSASIRKITKENHESTIREVAGELLSR